MSHVKVKMGFYKRQMIENEVFPLVREFESGKKHGFITVKGDAFGKGQVRIRVSDRDSYEIIHSSNTDDTVENHPMHLQTETDEEVIERIRERFEILDEMTKAAISGEIRSVIVSGPPGVGKSFGVERELDKAALFDQMAGRRIKHTIIKGSTSAIGLYKALYKYSDERSVVVFDDCDSILLDDVCLNLLKGALDSGKRRRISWLSESTVLRKEDIPDSFDFRGSVIFITNLKFDKMRSQKLKDHLDALQSRCHYLDLTLDTMRDKILRIKQIARTGELFQTHGIGQTGQQEIIQFMEDNQRVLREVSLRMAVKIAELYRAFPQKWQSMALTTCSVKQ